MMFEHPQWLWLALALLVTGLSGAVWAALKERRELHRYAAAPLLARMLPGRSLLGLRLTLVAMACALLALALAGPLYGERTDRVRPVGADVVIALDTSLSMGAEDVQPSRLARAKFEIGTLLDRLQGHRVGLVIFSGDAFLAVPLTVDLGAIRLYLDAVDVGTVPQPGSSFKAALQVAASAFDQGRAARSVVLFSDGEGTVDTPDDAARIARQNGLRVFPVGMGQAGGVPIPVHDDTGRLTGYKRDRNGQLVTSRLDQAALAHLAGATGGVAYVDEADGSGMGSLAGALAAMARGETGSAPDTRLENRYQWPLAVALLILGGEVILPARRLGRAA